MIAGYITIKETAEKWGINYRTVQTMCNDERIDATSTKNRQIEVYIVHRLIEDIIVR